MDKIEYTKEIIEEIRVAKLQRDKITMFFHCKSCILSKMPDNMSPSEYGIYEIGSVGIELSNGVNIGVVSIWCKHCGKLVWDSRHLKHAY